MNKTLSPSSSSDQEPEGTNDSNKVLCAKPDLADIVADDGTKSEQSVVCATNTLMLMLNQTRLHGETYQNLQWIPYDILMTVDYTAILDGALVKGSHGDVLARWEL